MENNRLLRTFVRGQTRNDGRLLLVFVAVAMMFVGCAGDGGGGGSDVVSVTVAKSLNFSLNNSSMLVGSEQVLPDKLKATFSDGTKKDVAPNYTSSDSTVAKIENRTIKAIKKGECNINAIYGAAVTSQKLKVLEAGEKALNSIAIAPKTQSLNWNGKQEYSVTASYSDGSSEKKDATWTLSPEFGTITKDTTNKNATYAATSVYDNDKVVTLTASFTYDKVTKTDSLEITVKKVPISGIEVSIPNNTVKVGGATLTLPKKAKLIYADGHEVNDAVDPTYSITTGGNATLQNGVITALKAGSETLTAKYVKDGNTYQKTYTITVLAADAKEIKSIAITPKTATNLASGANVTFTATATYSDNSTEAVTNSATWDCTPKNAGSMANNVFTADSLEADTNVTVTASYAGKTDTATITVKADTVSGGISGDFN